MGSNAAPGSLQVQGEERTGKTGATYFSGYKLGTTESTGRCGRGDVQKGNWTLFMFQLLILVIIVSATSLASYFVKALKI